MVGELASLSQAHSPAARRPRRSAAAWLHVATCWRALLANGEARALSRKLAVSSIQVPLACPLKSAHTTSDSRCRRVVAAWQLKISGSPPNEQLSRPQPGVGAPRGCERRCAAVAKGHLMSSPVFFPIIGRGGKACRPPAATRTAGGHARARCCGILGRPPGRAGGGGWRTGSPWQRASGLTLGSARCARWVTKGRQRRLP